LTKISKEAAIDEAYKSGEYPKIVWFYERPYRVNALASVAPLMTDEEFWSTLGEAWIDSENIRHHLDEWEALLREDRPGRECIMTEEERDAFATLDDRITCRNEYEILADPAKIPND
jgi:hypothetical protein